MYSGLQAPATALPLSGYMQAEGGMARWVSADQAQDPRARLAMPVSSGATPTLAPPPQVGAPMSLLQSQPPVRGGVALLPAQQGQPVTIAMQSGPGGVYPQQAYYQQPPPTQAQPTTQPHPLNYPTPATAGSLPHPGTPRHQPLPPTGTQNYYNPS